MIHAREMLEHPATSLGAAGGRRSQGAVSAAVDKIEEKRKPEDFIGHRKRGLRWKRGLNVLRRREMLEHPVIAQMERYGEMGVRRNVGAAIRRPRATNGRPYRF